MSLVGDALNSKNVNFLGDCKMIVTPDNAAAGEAAPTYTVRIEAPSYSKDIYTGVDAATVATYLTEFTDWVAAQHT